MCTARNAASRARRGCGYAELSLALAAQGYIVGVDLNLTAIAAANKAAQERGLRDAGFEEADITSFSGHDGRFNTVVDSTLFHSLSVEDRDSYLRSLHRAAAPGANYYVLVFAKGTFPDELETKPNEVAEDELRVAVSKYGEVDEIRPAYIHARSPAVPTAGGPDGEFPQHPKDEHGRVKLPAFLLRARKAS